MELLETLLSQLFDGINRKNWKRVVAFAVLLIAIAVGFAFWGSLTES